jgi:hypothetical protein
MFRNQHLDRVRQVFADQFQTENGHLVYRKSLKGPPMPLSEAERDRFVRTFNAGTSRLFWGLIAGTLILVVAVAGVAATAEEAVSDLIIWAIVIGPLVAVAPLWFRMWSAPERALAGRIPSGVALEPEAFRRQALRRMTWGQLLVALFMPLIILFQVSRDHDLSYGWNRLWLVGVGAFWAFAAVQAYRKWRAHHD